MRLAPRFSDVCVQVLASGAAVRFTATGSSMRPAIRDGDVLTVTPARSSEVAPGDVVLFRDGRRVVAHRVVGHEIEPPALLTRGDAGGQEHETVPAARVLGRVVRVERPGWLAGTRRRLARVVRGAIARGKAWRSVRRRPDSAGPECGQDGPAGTHSSIGNAREVSEFQSFPCREREMLRSGPDECA